MMLSLEKPDVDPECQMPPRKCLCWLRFDFRLVFVFGSVPSCVLLDSAGRSLKFCIVLLHPDALLELSRVAQVKQEGVTRGQDEEAQK